jgi:hypothetical protein
MDPNSALAANNAGFIYSRLQRFEESIQWTTTSIGLRRLVLTMKSISVSPLTSLTQSSFAHAPANSNQRTGFRSC